MKLNTIVAAITLTAASVLLPPPAQASCQNICVRAYNACLRMGTDPAYCEAELSNCLAGCGSIACQMEKGGGVQEKSHRRLEKSKLTIMQVTV